MELRGDNGIASRIINFNEVNERSGRGKRGEPQGTVTQAGNAGEKAVEKEAEPGTLAERNLCLLGSRDPGDAPRLGVPQGAGRGQESGGVGGCPQAKGVQPSDRGAARVGMEEPLQRGSGIGQSQVPFQLGQSPAVCPFRNR